jgi:hypothetical protein
MPLSPPSLDFRTTRLTGASHFYLADSALFSAGKQTLAGFVPRLPGFLLKLKPLSLPRCRSHRFIVYREFEVTPNTHRSLVLLLQSLRLCARECRRKGVLGSFRILQGNFNLPQDWSSISNRCHSQRRLVYEPQPFQHIHQNPAQKSGCRL